MSRSFKGTLSSKASRIQGSSEWSCNGKDHGFTRGNLLKHLSFVFMVVVFGSVLSLSGCDKSSGAKRAGSAGGSGGAGGGGAGGEPSDCEPVDEVCDGQDNDCDGNVDEGFAVDGVCSVGVGSCASEGRFVCNETGDDALCDAMPGEPDEELCDGQDNDCDGSTDEELVAFADLGEACDAGEGQCQREGVVVCSADGLSTACGAELGAPSNEVCDGQDNDCDGTTDEDTGGEACGVGRGACRADGMLECTDEGAGSELVCSESPGIPAIGAVDVCGAPNQDATLSPMSAEWIGIDRAHNEDCDDLIDERCTCAEAEVARQVPFSAVFDTSDPAQASNALGLGCLAQEPHEDPTDAAWAVPGGVMKNSGAPEKVFRFIAPRDGVFRFDVEPVPFDENGATSRNPVIELRPVVGDEPCASRAGAICRRDDGRATFVGRIADAVRHTGVVRAMQAGEEVWVIVQTEASDETGRLRLSITSVSLGSTAQVTLPGEDSRSGATTCAKRVVQRLGDDGRWCSVPDDADCPDAEPVDGICIDNDGRYVSVDLGDLVGDLGDDGLTFGGYLGAPAEVELGLLVPTNRADWFSMRVPPALLGRLLGQRVTFRLEGDYCVTNWLDLQVYAACAGQGQADQPEPRPPLGRCVPALEQSTTVCLGFTVDECAGSADSEHQVREGDVDVGAAACADGSALIVWVGVIRRSSPETSCLGCAQEQYDQSNRGLRYTVRVSLPPELDL